MTQEAAFDRRSALKLIWIPTLISLAMTLLRLSGELRHWSGRWFSTETGGIVPQGMSWLFGITWLAVPFGIYFGLKLRRGGERLTHPGRSILLALAGAILILFLAPMLISRLHLGFPRVLILIWLVMLLAALLQYPAWPSLFKTSLAYGFLSRIPVAVVMFLAMRGHWGTHYDYVGMPAEFQMTFWRGYFWLAFFPQLVFWVAFTAMTGTICGIVVVAIMQRLKPAVP